MRVEPEEYAGLDLRAHDLLASAPLHDAWAVDLPGGGDRSIADIRGIVSFENLARINLLREQLGHPVTVDLPVGVIGYPLSFGKIQLSRALGTGSVVRAVVSLENDLDLLA